MHGRGAWIRRRRRIGTPVQVLSPTTCKVLQRSEEESLCWGGTVCRQAFTQHPTDLHSRVGTHRPYH